jgi:hypothetical protein
MIDLVLVPKSTTTGTGVLPRWRGAGHEVSLLGDAERPARGEPVLGPRRFMVAGHVQEVARTAWTR